MTGAGAGADAVPDPGDDPRGAAGEEVEVPRCYYIEAAAPVVA